MPKAQINGIELYYESHGSGPAIVFAHGRGGNHISWWQQVARFSSGYRCITFDHRGWGQSIAEFGSPLRENFTADLAGLLDHLGIQQTFLVAQSMGGFCCLEFALANPDRTLGLVLGDTTGGVASPGVLAALGRATPPPDGVARSLAGSFIEEQPAPHLPLPRDRRPQSGTRGRRCHLRVPQRGGSRRGGLPRLADPDTADCGRRRPHFPTGRDRRGA